MPSMTDQARVNSIIQALYTSSTSASVTGGTSGGSGVTMTPPLKLRLMTTTGTNSSNGTEATGSNLPGYTAGGSSLGSSGFGAPTAGVQTNNNAVSWSITGTQTANVTGIEIWDSAGTPLRWITGALATAISGAVNGDTIQFAAGSISLNASAW